MADAAQTLSFTTLVNMVLNVVGAVGVTTMVIYMIRLAAEWGRMVALVETGFSANEKKLESVDDKLRAHGEQLGRLERSVGRLEGQG